MLTTRTEHSASTDHARLAPSNSVCRLHRGPLYGVSAPGCPQALPKHASLYLRGQIRSCACLLFRSRQTTSDASSFSQEEKSRKLLRVRLEMAKFLQETLRESGLKANAHILGSDAFKEFFRKVRRPFRCR